MGSICQDIILAPISLSLSHQVAMLFLARLPFILVILSIGLISLTDSNQAKRDANDECLEEWRKKIVLPIRGGEQCAENVRWHAMAMQKFPTRLVPYMTIGDRTEEHGLWGRIIGCNYI